MTKILSSDNVNVIQKDFNNDNKITNNIVSCHVF